MKIEIDNTKFTISDGETKLETKVNDVSQGITHHVKSVSKSHVTIGYSNNGQQVTSITFESSREYKSGNETRTEQFKAIGIKPNDKGQVKADANTWKQFEPIAEDTEVSRKLECKSGNEPLFRLCTSTMGQLKISGSTSSEELNTGSGSSKERVIKVAVDNNSGSGDA